MRLFCSILLGLALAACTTLRVTDIPIAKDATFDLLPPSALGESVSLEQIVDAKYGDKEFSFHCLLEVEPQKLTLVGMTPMNTRAFTLTLTDESFTLDMAPGVQLPADPARILADLQLALWPQPTVHGLETHDPTFYSGPGGGGMAREFRRDGTSVIEIYYPDSDSTQDGRWGKRLVFRHVEQNYELDVRTIRAEKLDP